MATQTVNQVTTSIPKEFYPYYGRVLDRAEALSLEPYQPYTGQRLANTSADTTSSYNMIRDMANTGLPGTEQAMGMTQDAYNAAGNIGNQGPYQFSQFGYSDPGTFSGQGIAQYMSPYMQNVVNSQKASALEDFQMANNSRAAQAVNAGAFGGSRYGVQQGLAERDMLTRMNDIQAQGLQKSYEDAQSMFEKDRAARMQTEQNRAAELSRVQSGQAADNLNYANLGLDSLRFQSGLATQLSDLERAARAGDVQAAQLLEASGKSQQAQQQAGLDTAYQDFLRQQGYPMQQLGQYSAILNGSPIANATTQTTQQNYNPIQQALGMGISALGLYNAYSGV